MRILHTLLACIILPTVAATGCMPVITHGPDVREGWRAGGAGAAGASSTDPEAFYDFFIFLGHGWTTESGRGGALTAHVRPWVGDDILHRTELDAYVQTSPAPQPAGIGLSVSFLKWMPYVQLGGNGTGADRDWYTTHGVVLTSDDFVGYAPSLSYIARSEAVDFHATAFGLIGGGTTMAGVGVVLAVH